MQMRDERSIADDRQQVVIKNENTTLEALIIPHSSLMHGKRGDM